MTTLAYSAAHGVLAADTCAVHYDMALGLKAKIGRRGRVLFGATGTSSAHCRRFVDWCSGGMVGDPPDAGDRDAGCIGFIFPDRDWIIQYDQNGFNAFQAEVFAAGSGKKYALGVLATGAHPVVAVDLTRRFDVYTNGPTLKVTRP